jgi:cytochrome c oxidase assembly protein subunit 15
MVTSTSSGLSVPDWPTTYGYSMFSFPLDRMAGGIFYEHGHRLIASTVGLLTIGLVIVIWRVDPRRWMRRLGLIALGAVTVQGMLGGLTVLYLLPASISIGHAALAQLFFCLTVAIALFTSRSWLTPGDVVAPVDDSRLRGWTTVVCVATFAQILLGATMRHLGAGLAIPDFPLAFGGLLPPAWPLPVAIHFAHRVGAVVVVLLIAATVRHVWTRHRRRPELTRVAAVLAALVTAQATLGALVVLTLKQPVVNTLHVATGALVLGTSVLLALRTYRVRFATAAPPELKLLGSVYSPPPTWSPGPSGPGITRDL